MDKSTVRETLQVNLVVFDAVAFLNQPEDALFRFVAELSLGEVGEIVQISLEVVGLLRLFENLVVADDLQFGFDFFSVGGVGIVLQEHLHHFGIVGCHDLLETGIFLRDLVFFKLNLVGIQRAVKLFLGGEVFRVAESQVAFQNVVELRLGVFFAHVRQLAVFEEESVVAFNRHAVPVGKGVLDFGIVAELGVPVAEGKAHFAIPPAFPAKFQGNFQGDAHGELRFDF